MTGKEDVAGDGKAPTAPVRRRWLSLLLAFGAVLLASGGTLAALELAHGPAGQDTTARLLRGCPQALGSAAKKLPHSLGTWRYELSAKGTFIDLSPAPSGRLIATQACGAEEQSLRLVELSRRARLIHASVRFKGAAPLASSALASEGRFFLGVGLLSISKSAPAAPYRLYCYVLGRRLGVERTIYLGRGYGVSLLPGRRGAVLASTGEALLRIEPDGSVRQVVSFVGEVLQHITLVPRSDEAIVSLFSPAAIPPTPSTTLAVVDLASGSVVSSAHLGAGAEVSSLALRGAQPLLVVGDGASQHLTATRGLRPLRLEPTRTSTTSLTPLELIGSPHLLLLSGLSELSCLSASGRPGPSTRPRNPSEVPTALARSPAGIFAVTPAGIGRLDVPPGCR